MLVEPERFAPGPFERERLSVQHMDGRWLRFPGETFDGIYSSGSIEHLGGLDFVANATLEMGRVLKPGGVLTLSTEFKIAGPPDGDAWDAGTLVLSEEQIRRYVIEACELVPVDLPLHDGTVPAHARVSNETQRRSSKSCRRHRLAPNRRRATRTSCSSMRATRSARSI